MKVGNKNWDKEQRSSQGKGNRKYLFANVRNEEIKKAFNNSWSDILHFKRKYEELIHWKEVVICLFVLFL